MTNTEHAESMVFAATGARAARHELEERYFRRMAAAVDEKTQLTDWLRGGRVLDIGAGGGELAARIAVLPDIEETIALDDSADAIAHLQQVPGITVRSGSADQLEVLGLRDLDGIVMSSVLHEIASYGPNGPENGRQAIMANLAIIAKALRPGGVLVIRDFVTPARPDRLTTLVSPGDDGDDLLSAYLEGVPLPELTRLESLGEHRFVGTARVVTEALLTVNWGAESLARETQEQYCQFELEELVDVVEALGAGLTPVHREAWVQPGYRQHLAAWSVLEQDGTPWFPKTKALWVFEKAASPLSTRA
ncbi:methyltransferase domain-containing protein [Pseudoclavibacter sp. RFBG4]|uniref:methyltransferase domain-containing protein n=1 Tax=Pseudoclavibacter sp. RFBG4 TaxID=2080575 RepID=UPI0011B0B1FC|nr:methyltransferase domain-containing protein [Pseudoclavibacter sp. RFBG4]